MPAAASAQLMKRAPPKRRANRRRPAGAPGALFLLEVARPRFRHGIGDCTPSPSPAKSRSRASRAIRDVGGSVTPVAIRPTRQQAVTQSRSPGSPGDMPGERSVGRATPSFWYTAAEIKTSADGALLNALPITRDAMNKRCPCAYIHATNSFHFLRRTA